MPPSTPHETKKCNTCKATKTSDAFVDRRGANGVVRTTLACDACRAKRARRAARREAARNGDGTSHDSGAVSVHALGSSWTKPSRGLNHQSRSAIKEFMVLGTADVLNDER
ncbi:hypothetical protein E4U13_008087 [Claviceps humidiphila]|uniref:Uncharacterized protein n=1 Tax=Claviceps humidiphila TaxID=1294629 RepID=A0A9P7Q534_9HYPO|nr:hypothetical protein E4U13_008087 [Claviceps humidiphila]